MTADVERAYDRYSLDTLVSLVQSCRIIDLSAENIQLIMIPLEDESCNKETMKITSR